MKLRILAITSVLVMSRLSGWSSLADASTLRIPVGLYPSGAHVAYLPKLSNERLDCLWGFFCEGDVPVFHLRTQSDMHRLDGWGQVAGWHHNDMTFNLFVSDYDVGQDEHGRPWSAVAFADLQSALETGGYRPFNFPVRNLQYQNQDGFLVEIQRNGPRDIVVVAQWSGSVEIEALVVFKHRSTTARTTALTDLRLQLLATDRILASNGRA